jgi:hypothetical protein
MRAWRAAAFLAAALLSVAATARPALAADTPSPAALAMTSPVLQQTASGRWQATVLVDGFTGQCPAGEQNRRKYRLETTSPARALTPVGASRAAPVPGRASAGQAGLKRAHAAPSRAARNQAAALTASCEVMLAREFGVAYQTLRHAMQVLRDRDLIITRQGRGTFVAAPVPGHD